MAIQVQNLHFAYEGRTVLEDVSLRVPAGEFTVLAVLHDPNLAFLSGDHLVFLKDGRVRETTGEERPGEAALRSEVYGTPIETLSFRDRALVVPF